MVGTFPYKGFFDRRMAEQEVARLEARGLDTYLREAVAYSTLGWFSDPVLEPLLKLNEVLIANIVLHELTHSTVFVTSRMDFNEAVASFVGQQGAVEFFATRDGPGSARHLEALRRAEDERRFGRFLKRVMEELRELYASKLPQEEKLRRRQEVFSRSRRALLAQRPLYHYPDLVDLYTEARLNNAFLLALELYTVDLEIYQAVYERLGRNLARAVALFKEAGRSGKPEAFLSQWLRAEGARAQTG
jgi:predicted aminopeptidase